MVRVQYLQRVAHGGVERPSPGLEQPVVHDAADPLVGEVEAVADRVHDPTPHEFLQTLRRLRRRDPGALLEQREAEVSTDDGSHRGQAAGRLGEALQAGGNEVPDTAGHHHGCRAVASDTVDELADRLDDHERVALARPPDLSTHTLDRRLGRASPQECADQFHGVDLRKRRETEPDQTSVALHLVERLAERSRFDQLLLAHASDEENGTLADAAANEREEPKTHLVRPVQIVQDEEEAPAGRALVHDGEHRLEEAERVARGARGRTQLGEQAAQLRAPRSEISQTAEDVAAAERIDPALERQGLLRFVEATHEHVAPGCRSLNRDFLEHTGLADSGLAGHDHRLSASIPRFLAGSPESREFRVAPDQHRLSMLAARS